MLGNAMTHEVLFDEKYSRIIPGSKISSIQKTKSHFFVFRGSQGQTNTQIGKHQGSEKRVGP